MDKRQLVKLGLSMTEATLYLALLRLGPSNVPQLIKETGHYKANAYDALEKLCQKGIISKIVENNKRLYQLQKPESLVEMIQKKKFELEQEEKLAEQLTKEVELSKKQLHVTETAMVFYGISGVKQIYSEIIRDKLDYIVYGSPIESETIVGDFYWKNLHAKQKEHKIKARMIFNKSLRHWSNALPKDIIELRFFDEKFEPLTETTIYGTKVAFVVWTVNPVITIIDNVHVADSYRQIFERLWKLAKS